eukprot:TRINITY_DN5661_c1_g1_i1.p1 TRINITY_DN5661_c1_g1~~TRINITY_DN5661_c1_g1_i1.p1  ORF type:complete len:401 (+),score=35.41 TRINITY_DN5661_c1_g1_i1:633-1835(+)
MTDLYSAFTRDTKAVSRPPTVEAPDDSTSFSGWDGYHNSDQPPIQKIISDIGPVDLSEEKEKKLEKKPVTILKWKWKDANWSTFEYKLNRACRNLHKVDELRKLSARITGDISRASSSAIPTRKKVFGSKRSNRARYRQIEMYKARSDPEAMKILCTLRKPEDEIIKELRINGKLVSDAKEMADAFTIAYANKYELAETEAPRIPGDGEGCEDFTMEELLKHVHKLQKKAPGPDGIWNTMLLHLPHNYLVHLLRLFNLSWKQSLLPKSWKDGFVVPILIPDKDPTDIESYQPIVLSSAIGKLFEKLIAERMYRLLQDKICFNTTFDMTSTYDEVQPSVLIEKMLALGLPSRYIKWIKNFLCGRKISAKVNGVRGSYKSIKVGIPRGSVLGPILLAIYLSG